MDEPARPERPLLAVHLEARRAAVDEVELVLRVVVVEEPLVPGWIDERVDAERGDAERRPDLPEAVALAQLVERRERVRHQTALLGMSV